LLIRKRKQFYFSNGKRNMKKKTLIDFKSRPITANKRIAFNRCQMNEKEKQMNIF